jgi:hypothetical protein
MELFSRSWLPMRTGLSLLSFVLFCPLTLHLSATKATIKLKHTMAEGEKRMRSYQLPPLDPASPLSSVSSVASLSSLSPAKPAARRVDRAQRGRGNGRLLTSQSQDSLPSHSSPGAAAGGVSGGGAASGAAAASPKRLKALSAIHSAPLRCLKRHPQDIGLKLCPPSSQRSVTSLSPFLSLSLHSL